MIETFNLKEVNTKIFKFVNVNYKFFTLHLGNKTERTIDVHRFFHLGS